MAPQENRQIRLLLGHQVNESCHILSVLIPRIDMPPLTRGAAMPPKVETINGKALRDEWAHHIRVSPAVLPEPVNNGQNCPGSIFRPPGLAIEIKTANTLKSPFFMFHHSSA
jgi:hypothetical protein